MIRSIAFWLAINVFIVQAYTKKELMVLQPIVQRNLNNLQYALPYGNITWIQIAARTFGITQQELDAMSLFGILSDTNADALMAWITGKSDEDVDKMYTFVKDAKNIADLVTQQNNRDLIRYDENSKVLKGTLTTDRALQRIVESTIYKEVVAKGTHS
jgi:hypothetical protein